MIARSFLPAGHCGPGKDSGQLGYSDMRDAAMRAVHSFTGGARLNSAKCAPHSSSLVEAGRLSWLAPRPQVEGEYLRGAA